MESFFDGIRRLGFRRGPERMLAGICGGIAAATRIDVVIVRVIVLLTFLLPFIGLGAYVVAWLLLPWQDGSIPAQRILRSIRSSGSRG